MSEYVSAVPSIIFLTVVIAVNIVLLRRFIALQNQIKRSRDFPWNGLVKICTRIITVTLILTLGCGLTQVIGSLFDAESASMQSFLKVASWFAVIFVLYQLLMLITFVFVGLNVKQLLKYNIVEKDSYSNNAT